MGDIAWNLEALHEDAAAWRCVSQRLGAAEGLLSQVRLSQGDFMSFLPSSASAAAEVATAVSALEQFASRGEERTLQGSKVLLEVAEAYRLNEEEARKALDGMWEPEGQ